MTLLELLSTFFEQTRFSYLLACTMLFFIFRKFLSLTMHSAELDTLSLEKERFGRPKRINLLYRANYSSSIMGIICLLSNIEASRLRQKDSCSDNFLHFFFDLASQHMDHDPKT